LVNQRKVKAVLAGKGNDGSQDALPLASREVGSGPRLDRLNALFRKEKLPATGGQITSPKGSTVMPTQKTYITPSLLQPDNHAPILIDQQYLQLLTMRSHDATLAVNATALLAKGAKLFGVKTLLATAFSNRQALIKDVQSVFSEQKPIDRTTLNAFENERVVSWVANTVHTRNWRLLVSGPKAVSQCLRFQRSLPAIPWRDSK
jgi:hypothetical protein